MFVNMLFFSQSRRFHVVKLVILYVQGIFHKCTYMYVTFFKPLIEGNRKLDGLRLFSHSRRKLE